MWDIQSRLKTKTKFLKKEEIINQNKNKQALFFSQCIKKYLKQKQQKRNEQIKAQKPHFIPSFSGASASSTIKVE